MPTFSPTRALVSVVLPALGRPTRQAKPLRYGGWSGGVTPAILPPGDDTPASPVPCGTAGRLGSVAGRRRPGAAESAAQRAGRGRQRHLGPVWGLPVPPARGSRRSA